MSPDADMDKLVRAVGLVNTATNTVEADKLRLNLTGICFALGWPIELSWSAWGTEKCDSPVSAIEEARAIVKEAFTWPSLEDLGSRRYGSSMTAEERRADLNKLCKTSLAHLSRLKKELKAGKVWRKGWENPVDLF